MAQHGYARLMSSSPSLPRIELLVYGFDPGFPYEGQLVGALERIEGTGTLRVLDLLFVTRDAESGEVGAISLKGSSAGGLVAPLVGFRLDLAERRKATRRALAGTRPNAVPPDTLREIGAALEPGAALAAVLIEHAGTEALDDAAARMHGVQLAAGFVEAAGLADVAPALVAAAGARRDAAAAERPPDP